MKITDWSGHELPEYVAKMLQQTYKAYREEAEKYVGPMSWTAEQMDPDEYVNLGITIFRRVDEGEIAVVSYLTETFDPGDVDMVTATGESLTDVLIEESELLKLREVVPDGVS